MRDRRDPMGPSDPWRELCAKLDRQRRWLVGLLLAKWVTTIVAVLLT